MAKRSKTPTFIFEVELSACASDFTKLNVASQMSRKIYNAVLGKLLRRLNQMRDREAYKAALGLPKTVSGKANEQRRDAFANLRVEFS